MLLKSIVLLIVGVVLFVAVYLYRRAIYRKDALVTEHAGGYIAVGIAAACLFLVWGFVSFQQYKKDNAFWTRSYQLLWADGKWAVIRDQNYEPVPVKLPHEVFPKTYVSKPGKDEDKVYLRRTDDGTFMMSSER